MDYEKKWNELKEIVNEMAQYYNKGIMCSLAESIHGESVCKEVLHEMEKLENKN